MKGALLLALLCGCRPAEPWTSIDFTLQRVPARGAEPDQVVIDARVEGPQGRLREATIAATEGPDIHIFFKGETEHPCETGCFNCGRMNLPIRGVGAWMDCVFRPDGGFLVTVEVRRYRDGRVVGGWRDQIALPDRGRARFENPEGFRVNEMTASER
jgi:hypothetical protein